MEKRERTNMSPGSDGDRVKGGWPGILRRMVRKGHTDMMTFEQSPDGSDGSRQVDSGTIASARVLRREHTAPGAARRPVWLEQRRGEVGGEVESCRLVVRAEDTRDVTKALAESQMC